MTDGSAPRVRARVEGVARLVRYYVGHWREHLRLPVTVYFKRYDADEQAREAASMPTRAART